MSHVRLECVAVHVSGLANDLVADLLVAHNGVSSLDGLQNGGRAGDSVHGWCLWDESLAVDGSESGHCSECWHCGNTWSVNCFESLISLVVASSFRNEQQIAVDTYGWRCDEHEERQPIGRLKLRKPARVVRVSFGRA